MTSPRYKPKRGRPILITHRGHYTMTITLPKSGDTVDKDNVVYSHLEVVTLIWPVVQKHMGVKVIYHDGSTEVYITADARTLWQYLHGVPLPKLEVEALRETPTQEDIRALGTPQETTKPPLDKSRPHEEGREGLAISSNELDDMLNPEY